MSKPQFGSIKVVKEYGNDGEVADLDLFHAGERFGTYKQFKVRHIVHSVQEQTIVYSKFVNDITDKRKAGNLALIQDEPSTIPSFIIKYPKRDVDGSYLVITSWAEKV